MTLEHVALLWQNGVDFGFKAGVEVGLAWLWSWATRRR